MIFYTFVSYVLINSFGTTLRIYNCTLSFKTNTFRSNARLKLAKYKTKVKQHPEAELFLFLFWNMYKKQMLLFKWSHMINDNENETENET